MSNIFNNFLGSISEGSGNVRDYQHASRLYVTGNYELLPKSGWMYYVVMKINPAITLSDPSIAAQFVKWKTQYGGFVGVLAKQVGLPKFSVETETLNQYNRAVVIQKKIKYSPTDITFHDDSANATTNLWKYYYEYYYADSISNSASVNIPEVLPKYQNTKYNVYTDSNLRYGLNNLQTVPFFTSIDIYQLHQHKFTTIRLINPIIKSWDHGVMDQSQGNTLVTSKMVVEFETVTYSTVLTNISTKTNPGFASPKYDSTPSPLSIGGVGTNNVFGPLGVIAGSSSVLGDLSNAGNLSALDLLKTGINAASLAKNIKNVNMQSITAEGYSLVNSTLSNLAASPSAVNGPNGSLTSGIQQAVSPAGINLSMNTSNISGSVTAIAKKLGST